MKSIVLSVVLMVLLIGLGLLGLFAAQPGLTLAAICALPLATGGLGFAMGRAGLRVVTTSGESF